MPEHVGIQACMRLNARLHRRIDWLVETLARFAATACSGSNDENGQHIETCMRCAAGKALEDYRAESD